MYLLRTYTKGHYLTPVQLRKVRRHPYGGWMICGIVSEPNADIRDEMLFWSPSFKGVVAHAKKKNL